MAEAWRKRRYKAHFISKLSDAEGESEETRVWLESRTAAATWSKMTSTNWTILTTKSSGNSFACSQNRASGRPTELAPSPARPLARSAACLLLLQIGRASCRERV